MYILFEFVDIGLTVTWRIQIDSPIYDKQFSSSFYTKSETSLQTLKKPVRFCVAIFVSEMSCNFVDLQNKSRHMIFWQFDNMNFIMKFDAHATTISIDCFFFLTKLKYIHSFKWGGLYA